MSLETCEESSGTAKPQSSTKLANRTIGFVLSSNVSSPLPSTRISVLNMLPFLTEAGYASEIFFEPQTPSERPDVHNLSTEMLERNVSIAYFQKVLGPSVLREVRNLSKAGIKTVFGVCDVVDNDMAAATDATIVVTDYLRGLYAPELRHKIHVVHDGIEHPEVFKRHYGQHRMGRVSAVLVTSSQLEKIPVIGMPPKFLDVTVVGHYPILASRILQAKELYWKLRQLTTNSDRLSLVRSRMFRRFSTKNWSADSVYSHMTSADIGIIPVEMKDDPIAGLTVSSWQVKSENRLTLSMALGLPVIASPVPSYFDVIVHGKNGYFAETRNDWLRYLRELRDPELRRCIGEEARRSVFPRYSKEEQARKLIAVLDIL